MDEDEAGVIDIFAAATANTDFRRVLVTNENSQAVVMCVPPGQDLGEEVHRVDQLLVFVSGSGTAILDGKSMSVQRGSMASVPAGTRHNFVNTGSAPLRLFTVYAPPQHEHGIVHGTKADADDEKPLRAISYSTPSSRIW